MRGSLGAMGPMRVESRGLFWEEGHSLLFPEVAQW